MQPARWFGPGLAGICLCTQLWTHLSTGTIATAADWPQWGGSDARTMASAETGLPARFEPGKRRRDRLGVDPATTKNVAWVAALGSENYSAPTVAAGRVLVGTNDEKLEDPRLSSTRGGVLLCLDQWTGKLLWRLVVPKLEIDRSKVERGFRRHEPGHLLFGDRQRQPRLPGFQPLRGAVPRSGGPGQRQRRAVRRRSPVPAGRRRTAAGVAADRRRHRLAVRHAPRLARLSA